MNNEQAVALSTRNRSLRMGARSYPRSAGPLKWSLLGCICDEKLSDPDPARWSERGAVELARSSFVAPQARPVPHQGTRAAERDERPTTRHEQAASLALEIALPISSLRNNALAALNFLDRQAPDLDAVREALRCLVGDADRAGDIIDRMRDHVKKSTSANGSDRDSN